MHRIIFLYDPNFYSKDKLRKYQALFCATRLLYTNLEYFFRYNIVKY